VGDILEVQVGSRLIGVVISIQVQALLDEYVKIFWVLAFYAKGIQKDL